ncbi:MAG: 2-oxo acid dehydrogenase subunit E2 [Spirochaetae bacterium HGW-Spirochaetae-7]|nr:MAG: 2-oxo acid dehydrogenase subunit E2 [Spirochaetae bacterium HGW-Spirochaetae-7]
MTALSPTMQDGVIAGWLVSEGQAVKPGDALCEIETDKATMPYESPRAGTILKITALAGARAAVGETIAVIGKPGEDWQSVVPAIPAITAIPALTAIPATSSALPALEAGPVPLPAPVIAVPSAPAAVPPLNEPAFPSLGPSLPASTPPSSPLARKLARERGIDLRSLRGTGPHGRVIRRDVPSAGSVVPSTFGGESSTATHADRGAVAARTTGGRLRGDRVPISKMRSIIAGRLGTSWTQAPHFFVRAAVDMEKLLDLRASVNAGRDRPVGLNAFVMRLVAAALERHPIINASWEGDAIRYRPAADIGLAVALEGGLVTPVVRACERKGVEEIDAELADLVARARKGLLSPEEYSEASFTISNLGSSGVEEFTAIINPPGSAILALGAVSKEAVVRGDDIVARRMMRITVSSDHRVIDGAAAASFLSDLKALLEEPARGLL